MRNRYRPWFRSEEEALAHYQRELGGAAANMPRLEGVFVKVTFTVSVDMKLPAELRDK